MQNQTTKNSTKYFHIYSFLLIGFMPIIVTPWNNDVFYSGKILFSLFISFFLFIYLLKTEPALIFNKSDKVLWIVIIYGLLITLSTIFSVDLKLSIFGHYRSREGLIILLLYLFVFYMFYKLFTFSVVLLESILICATIISILGILNYLEIIPSISNLIDTTKYSGDLSTIGNRNFAGTYSTLLLPLAIGYFLYYKNKIRAFFYASTIFGFLITSRTRSTWIAFFIYIFLFFILNIGNKKILKYLFIFISLFFFITIFINYLSDNSIFHRFQLIFSDFQNPYDDDFASNRTYYWKRTIPHLLDKPILGSGPDTFGIVFRKFGDIDIYFEKVHNEYIQLALTMGFPVLYMYIIIAFDTIKGLYKNHKNDYFSKILLCCIIGYLFQALSNFSMFTNAVVFWALLGIGMKYTSYKN